MPTAVHHLYRVRLNGEDVYLAWRTGEGDGFARDSRGRLLAADSPEALRRIPELGRARWDHEAAADHDLDRLRAWCGRPSADEIDHDAFLQAWNFLDDLAGLFDGTDSEYTNESGRAETCYAKLLGGCRSHRPANHEPARVAWEDEEIDTIRSVLESGLSLLEAELQATGYGSD